MREAGAARMKTGRFLTIRWQLLLLFGVLILAGTSVLVLDQWYGQRHQATLSHLYNDALGGQQSVKQMTQAYATEILGVTFKVRNNLMRWDAGLDRLDQARQHIDQASTALHAEVLPLTQQQLLARIDRERALADQAVATLRTLLKSQDMQGLGNFADTRLFPALDPLLTDLDRLAEAKISAARRQLADDAARARRLTWWRIGLSALALLIVLATGRAVLRNIYRGIEQLVRLARNLRRGRYGAQVGERPHGEVGMVMDVFVDMRDALRRNNAELRQSEARAQEASRTKSSFLAAMSHEIRTPMIGITGMLELLALTRLDAEQRRCVNIVQSSAQSLLQIIGDILDFSKIEAGRMQLALETIDLKLLLEHTTHNFLGIASSKGLTLELILDPQLSAAYIADPLRLRQILSNLLSNALKFTQAGGVIVNVRVLSVRDDGRHQLAIGVRDSGIGLSAEQRATLFQPFVQGESGTARQFGGSGLGLAICRQLARLMDGEIELASKVGLGSTFTLAVSLAPGDPANVAAHFEPAAELEFSTRPVPSIEAAEREHSLILVVDDHPTNREVLSRQMARAGFACETAADGEEALARWQSGRYALVLTDIHMPRMDGYQLTAAMRTVEAKKRRARTPVIAITANVSKGEPERCLAADMDDFLGKPFRIAQLASMLHRWLPHLEFGQAAVDPSTAALPMNRVADDAPDEPVDRAALAEVTGDDAAFAHNLLVDFLATAKRDVDALHAAMGARDAQTLAREAHRVKGAAALVGARQLQAAADIIEQTARVGNLEAAGVAVGELDTALQRFAQWLLQESA